MPGPGILYPGYTKITSEFIFVYNKYFENTYKSLHNRVLYDENVQHEIWHVYNFTK